MRRRDFIAVLGGAAAVYPLTAIDTGKNTFHLVGLDQRGNVVLQLKTSRAKLERRLANVPSCLVGMEPYSGTHHIARHLEALGRDVRLIPAQYVKPFPKGHKNDYCIVCVHVWSAGAPA